MFHRNTIINQLPQRVDADAQVLADKVLADHLVAFLGLDTLGHHGVVGHKKQCARRDFVVEADCENGGGFHIDSHAANLAEIVLEIVVVFPHTAVGGVDRSRPIVAAIVTNGGGYGFFEAKCRQRRHFRREIVVRGTFTTDSCDRKNQVADLVDFLDATAFAEKQHRLGLWRHWRCPC